MPAVCSCRLIEPADRKTKETVRYLTEHFSQIRSAVRRQSRGLPEFSIDEVMSDLAMSLMQSDDFDESRSKGMSIQDYIELYGSLCVKRYKSNMAYESYNRAENTINQDGEEFDILEFIPSREETSSKITLEEALDDLKGKRYQYGTDIFTCLYVRILTMKKNGINQDMLYKKIMTVLGGAKINRNVDSIMYEVVRAIVDYEAEGGHAENIIKKYVYSADKIEETVRELAGLEN